MRVWVLVLLVLIAGSAAAQTAPQNERAAVIERALKLLYVTATNADSFSNYGNDLLWSFFSIADTSSDPALRAQALHMGQERAAAWHLDHRHVPADASPTTLLELIQGGYAAGLLGQEDAVLKAELRSAAARYTARDFLKFDAPREPPSASDPHRFDVYTDALIHTWFADAYGVHLGASHHDVIQWLPNMRPYRLGDEQLESDEFYAVTHMIYTLGGYLQQRVSPAGLGPEIAFLKRKMTWAIANDDPEMVGEGMDSLKALGLERDPLVRKGEVYLLANQRPDGAWAGGQDEVYTLYHSAWTGIDGLRDHRFRGGVVTFLSLARSSRQLDP
jgi:hypothetical protein